MTRRKPPPFVFESWVDRQIREAAERGAFEDLPGSGRPLPGKGEPYDELWWVKEKLKREQVSFLPPTLVLRKEAEVALEAALRARTEVEVRRLVGDINVKIRHAIRFTPAGPPLNLLPYDADAVVRDWATRRPPEPPSAPPVRSPEAVRRRWLRRR